jgi:hypothetical protein
MEKFALLVIMCEFMWRRKQMSMLLKTTWIHRTIFAWLLHGKHVQTKD